MTDRRRSTVVERAYAKLTLALRVLGARADGYHEIEALVVTLSDPCDVVRVARRAPGAPTSVRIAGPAAAGVPSGRENLAARAAAAAGAGAEIWIDKVVPAGAGLGGGSADAAAVLRALGVRDPGVAAQIGSDVPACLDGGPTWARGRGERLEPAALRGPVHVVTAVPAIRLATPAVYAAWDAAGGPAGEDRLAPPPAVAALVGALVNDLEPAAERLCPELRDLRRRCEAVAGRPMLLAGSGSACWTWFGDAGEAQGAARALGEALPVQAWAGGVRPRAAGLSGPAGDAASGSS